jgi:hypothetical protein
VLSAALLLYYWLDFLVGSWLRIWPVRLRTGLVVMERGWWDLLVDPRRYRLSGMPRLTRLLGTLLPQPDLVLLLDAPHDTFVARKRELAGEEIERQTRAWRELPATVTVIDASLDAADVSAAAREEVVRFLHERAVARLGAGWVSLPSRSAQRWLLPRAPRVARSALLAYQPITVRSRVGWGLARAAAPLGAFHLLRRGPAPPKEVRDALAPHLPPRSTFAVVRQRGVGRWTALVVDQHGTCRFIAKLAVAEAGQSGLREEAEVLSRVAPLLPAPLAAPRLLAQNDGLLLLEYVPWRPRLRPWRLPEPVGGALGAFFASTGYAHGDCAPWNLLETEDGWTLVDWEDARPGAPSFFDVSHYVVRGCCQLGRPSPRVIRRGLQSEGWVGAAMRAYAAGAGLDPGQARDALRRYSRVVGREFGPALDDEQMARRTVAGMLDR